MQSLQKHSNPEPNSAGFSLIECVVAVGILSVILVQVLNVQVSTISLTQITRDNMRATWALKQMEAQMEYYSDTYGTTKLPAGEVSVPWPAAEGFVMQYVFAPLEIPASRFLFSAMRIGNAHRQKGEEGVEESDVKDPAEQMKGFGDMIDGQIPKDLYTSAKLLVTWPDGETRKSMESGFMFIDEKKLEDLLKMMKNVGKNVGAGGAGADLGGKPAGAEEAGK